MTSPRFSLVPAAYLLLLREHGNRTEVLLQLRQNTGYMDGYWACGVAGHVEPGESVLVTASREAEEELGLHVAPEALVPLTAMHRSNDVGGAALEQRVDFFFSARHWEGEPRVQEKTKNADLQWFALDSLPMRVPPHERAVLGWLRTQLAGGAPVPPVVVFGFDGEVGCGDG
ncbi:NTP pyrophosphohydrolases containing a Zn-finger, probably nucleic-acid-binding [Actinomyces bovis]|uniref:NTP pyrophosphohydrolases containing a Zn-finger, probably nucleic-acid-binding n=1 Tax=Actinomyces bovis TaxID=1658 RepID=A0ABY1VM70_9ACTO|nr:NUDIX domain-containing protein [Actinomyces bovis]SPT53206.1 NTP pyrophosphohydrolases containing a Zn-finger, probably nucleic-acid-binding [Actinomyces bovis]VEG52428.1 NTP pyrophosphohydrolases containing a Zn-finger, probably nucleic-acid-binding [Actinomyces israelii]